MVLTIALEPPHTITDKSDTSHSNLLSTLTLWELELPQLITLPAAHTPALRLSGTTTLLSLPRTLKLMPLLLPSHHQKHQLSHHFQTCHGCQPLLRLCTRLLPALLPLLSRPLLLPPSLRLLNQPLLSSGLMVRVPLLLPVVAGVPSPRPSSSSETVGVNLMVPLDTKSLQILALKQWLLSTTNHGNALPLHPLLPLPLHAQLNMLPQLLLLQVLLVTSQPTLLSSTLPSPFGPQVMSLHQLIHSVEAPTRVTSTLNGKPEPGGTILSTSSLPQPP